MKAQESSEPGVIADVEMHDAKIDGVVLSRDDLRLIFEKLPVFYEIASLQYQVWICRAELNLHGVTQFEFMNPDARDRLVDDGTVADADGQLIEWRTLLSDRPVSRLHLVLASGGVLEVHCEHAHLIITMKEKYLEDWSGPL